MNPTNPTVQLFRSVVQEAGLAFTRTVWAIGVLVLFAVMFQLAATFLGIAPDPTGGLGGGLLLGLLNAFGCGWYIAMLEIGLVQKRHVRVDDVREQLGTYLWEVIGILFIFWIGQLVLMAVSGDLLWIAMLGATILFNPAPELIYQSRQSSLELLKDATRFMQTNWPEWLLLHVAGAAALTLWAWLAVGHLDLTIGVQLTELFGPFFGFIRAPTIAWSVLGPSVSGIASFAGMLLFVHYFMVLRGVLYAKLSTSSRRSRTWQARL